MRKQRVKILQSLPPFGGLSEYALEVLVGKAPELSFEASDTLIREGGTAGTVFILMEGRARVEKRYRGQPFPLCWVTSGDCIGEVSLLDPGPRSASVIAETRVRAMCLGTSDFYRLRQVDLAQFTLLQLNIAREVCRRLRRMEVLLMDAVHGRANLELSLESLNETV